jgi:predicted ferric reductase
VYYVLHLVQCGTDVCVTTTLSLSLLLQLTLYKPQQQETLSFHKLAGVLATFWGLMHGIFCTFPLITLSWEWYYAMAWDPSFATGEWIFAGQLAVIMQVIMVIFATKYFRTHHYWLFRGTHMLYPLIFMASVCHRWECVYYFQLGMILIMADVAARLSVKVHTSKATLTATGSTTKGERTVVVQAKSPFPTGAAKGLLLPGRFFYLQVPDVSVCEWHPMSVTHADADGNLTFVIKVFGTLLLLILQSLHLLCYCCNCSCVL